MEALYMPFDQRLFSPEALKILGLELTIAECNASIVYLDKMKKMATMQLDAMRKAHEENQTNAED